MSAAGPMAGAYAALHRLTEQALRSGGVLGQADVLHLDPESAFEPNGNEKSLITAAALLKVQTRPGRAQMGGPKGCIWSVERDVKIELACAGHKAQRDSRLEVFEAGLAAIAQTLRDDPTLGGSAERCWIVGREDGDLPPNGCLAILGVTLRVRSGDELGLTWP